MVDLSFGFRVVSEAEMCDGYDHGRTFSHLDGSECECKCECEETLVREGWDEIAQSAILSDECKFAWRDGRGLSVLAVERSL